MADDMNYPLIHDEGIYLDSIESTLYSGSGSFKYPIAPPIPQVAYRGDDKDWYDMAQNSLNITGLKSITIADFNKYFSTTPITLSDFWDFYGINQSEGGDFNYALYQSDQQPTFFEFIGSKGDNPRCMLKALMLAIFKLPLRTLQDMRTMLGDTVTGFEYSNNLGLIGYEDGNLTPKEITASYNVSFDLNLIDINDTEEDPALGVRNIDMSFAFESSDEGIAYEETNILKSAAMNFRYGESNLVDGELNVILDEDIKLQTIAIPPIYPLMPSTYSARFINRNYGTNQKVRNLLTAWALAAKLSIGGDVTGLGYEVVKNQDNYDKIKWQLNPFKYES
jgi:hypothetical protein